MLIIADKFFDFNTNLYAIIVDLFAIGEFYAEIFNNLSCRKTAFVRKKFLENLTFGTLFFLFAYNIYVPLI